MPTPSELNTSEVPQAVLNKISEGRQIGSVKVSRIEKSGSSLHLLDTPDKQQLLRNGEIKESSAATWEFAHSYATALFPDNLKQILFGVWDRPQIVPILEKNGKNRIYHRNELASVYSQMMGIDTARLAEMWDFDDILSEYIPQSGEVLREVRWLGSTTYHLTKAVADETEWLDPNKKLIGLMDDYWLEFTRLNVDIINRDDLLYKKELRRQDVDQDYIYQSSIKLVAIGHQICDLLRLKYQELRVSQQKPEWRGKSGQATVLFLLHLHQTRVQQMLLWWLGIAHGHLHLYNSVARIPEDPQNAPSPLETTIIDFDRSRVSSHKLANHEELYKNINTTKVKDLIGDESKNIHLRLTLILYLPLSEWDDSVMRLVNENSENNISDQIANLVSLRMIKNVTDEQRYTWFASFLLNKEKLSVRGDSFPTFRLTIKVVKEKPDLITEKNQNLSILSKLFTDGLHSLNKENITDDQQLLLLSGIFYLSTNNIIINDLDRDHLIFAFNLVSKSGNVGSHATELLIIFFESYDKKLIKTLVDEAKSGNLESRDLLRKLLHWLLPINELQYRFAAQTVICNAMDQDYLDYLLDLIDFESLNKETAEAIYFQLRNNIKGNWRYEDDEKAEQLVLKKLDKMAKQSVGKLFIWQQKIKKILTRK